MNVSQEPKENKTLHRILKSILTVVTAFLVVRIVRVYTRANAESLRGIREHYAEGSEIIFVLSLAIPVVVLILIVNVILFVIKGRDAVEHPLFILPNKKTLPDFDF